ncbi:MAG: zinc-ribbon domain, partial [Pseudomonadota bacterium]
MALITCNECGRQISDRASSCPGCGAPVAGNAPVQQLIDAGTAKTA